MEGFLPHHPCSTALFLIKTKSDIGWARWKMKCLKVEGGLILLLAILLTAPEQCNSLDLSVSFAGDEALQSLTL